MKPELTLICTLQRVGRAFLFRLEAEYLLREVGSCARDCQLPIGVVSRVAPIGAIGLTFNNYYVAR